MEILRNFAVFEGLDGSGTTTQLTILDAFFHQKKAHQGGLNLQSSELMQIHKAASQLKRPPFYKTFEPTDGIIGRIIRSGLKKEGTLRPETLAFLFAADRNEHLYCPNGIAERCNRGELVVSDRYIHSSVVYQGITCGDELPARLNQGFPGPELLLFFDIDPATAQKRMFLRQQKEIYENLDFQINVRRRYKELLPQFADQGVKVEIIDASLPPVEIALIVWRHLEKMPIFKM